MSMIWPGALMGEPLLVGKAKTVDVMVPAYAEIVIEGHILANESIDEGPFGEYNRQSDRALHQ